MSANSPIPLGKFAWLILAAVIAAPTAFFLLVTPKEPDEPTAPPAEKRPLSKLESVGLRENRDWDDLPAIFAVWADKAEWKDGKTYFCYWNPTDRDYTYFLEARKTKQGYRFRIPNPSDYNRMPHGIREFGVDVPLQFLVTLPAIDDPAEETFIRRFAKRFVEKRSSPPRVEIDFAESSPSTPKKP